MLYTARGKAIDEQNDITPTNKLIDQFSLCPVGHAGTAMQSDDRGKRAYTLGLGQIPLYAVARNELPGMKCCEGPSNSTRSSGPAKASTTKARAAHHSVSTIAVGKVTVLGNGVSLGRLA